MPLPKRQLPTLDEYVEPIQQPEPAPQPPIDEGFSTVDYSDDSYSDNADIENEIYTEAPVNEPIEEAPIIYPNQQIHNSHYDNEDDYYNEDDEDDFEDDFDDEGEESPRKKKRGRNKRKKDKKKKKDDVDLEDPKTQKKIKKTFLTIIIAIIAIAVIAIGLKVFVLNKIIGGNEGDSSSSSSPQTPTKEDTSNVEKFKINKDMVAKITFKQDVSGQLFSIYKNGDDYYSCSSEENDFIADEEKEIDVGCLRVPDEGAKNVDNYFVTDTNRIIKVK